MKWSAKEGQIWVEYPEKNIQDALTEAFSKGREILTLQTMTGRELTIDIDMMVEIDLLTSKRRDLRCEYEGEFPPRRPAPNFDQDTLAEFEARVLSFLASRQLRFSDIFNEIDHDRNGWLTKLEVHLFFVHNVWSDTLPAVTTYIFEAMESGGQIGRVNYHSFSQASKQMKRVLDFEKQKKGIIMTKKLALKQSRAAVAASTKHDDSQKSDDLKERRSLDIATSDLSSPVEVFHIPEAMFGNTPDGKELGNEQKLSDRQDKPLSPNGLRIQIPLDYRTHKDLSPRSWIVSSWYWRSGEKASEARHLSALACARSHALLLLNTHRMHHHIEDVEKLKQQELHSAATAFAADVSSTNADLSDALTAALQEEANETARARDLVIQLKKAIDSDTLLLEDAIRARKDVDKSNAQLCSSSWEQVENYRCSIHKLERELVIAEERYMKRSNLTSCTSIAAQKVSEMTQALIETTRHMAQVRVEAELLRIAYRVAEKQHVVSFREAQKHEGVLLAHKAVLEAERAEVKALELFHKAEADVEAAVLALEQEDKIIETDYIDIPALRTKVSHLFDSIENKLEGGRNKGQEGYYTFSESSLGQTLFNARGTIAEEFRIHQHDIDPYQAHLSGDRPAWGGMFDR
jgi:co-chaperonin GroES (HSP10)